MVGEIPESMLRIGIQERIMGVSPPHNTGFGTIRAAKGLGPDPFLLTVVLLILTIGVVMVTSAGYIIAAGKFGDGLFFTKKQGLAMLLGLGVMYLFSIVNPNFWRRAAVPLMGLSMILLALVFVPGLGVEMGGSRRWVRLPLGFYLQPSEIIKYALIMFIAGSLAKKGAGVKDFAGWFSPACPRHGDSGFFHSQAARFRYRCNPHRSGLPHAVCSGRKAPTPVGVRSAVFTIPDSGSRERALQNTQT